MGVLFSYTVLHRGPKETTDDDSPWHHSGHPGIPKFGQLHGSGEGRAGVDIWSNLLNEKKKKLNMHLISKDCNLKNSPGQDDPVSLTGDRLLAPYLEFSSLKSGVLPSYIVNASHFVKTCKWCRHQNILQTSWNLTVRKTKKRKHIKLSFSYRCFLLESP